MEKFKFSLVFHTRENGFYSIDENIWGIHSKRVYILYVNLLQPLVILYVPDYFVKTVDLLQPRETLYVIAETTS